MGYNSTIITKKKLLSCGHTDYNFSKGRCKSCATIASVANRVEKENEREGLQDLIKDLDAIFSKYVRKKAANALGVAPCYTCGHKARWQDLQNGHFIPRANMFLRFDLRNCKPQCKDCNEYRSGNMVEYRKRLEKESPGIVEILEEESHLIYKYTQSELISLISEYTLKLATLYENTKNSLGK